MRKYLPLVLAVLLAGCAYTITAYQNPDGTLIRAGMTKDEVRQSWGQAKNEVSLSRLSGLVVSTDAWEYDFATVFFVQNSIVEKIVPKTTSTGPTRDQAGAGGRR